MVAISDDNTRALRLLSGQGDIALNAVSARLLTLFDDEAFRVESAPGIGTMYLGFNLESYNLHDARVRQAIAHAIDRDAPVNAKYNGFAQTTETWIPNATLGTFIARTLTTTIPRLLSAS
ncbi:MAG: ABC transporter substrate-binding protein [Polyangiales bacterium]